MHLQVWTVQTEVVLIRQRWQQEVGCVCGALSQEVADCIRGGTDGGGHGRDGLRDCREIIGGK